MVIKPSSGCNINGDLKNCFTCQRKTSCIKYIIQILESVVDGDKTLGQVEENLASVDNTNALALATTLKNIVKESQDNMVNLIMELFKRQSTQISDEITKVTQLPFVNFDAASETSSNVNINSTNHINITDDNTASKTQNNLAQQKPTVTFTMHPDTNSTSNNTKANSVQVVRLNAAETEADGMSYENSSFSVPATKEQLESLNKKDKGQKRGLFR